ncbi:MAG: helix-turn-helix transcriptional regulator [Bacteroidales bacterium]|nr:helix-turn-helix transcriptional regulator [Bacteroidales bacterium]
MKKDYIDPVFQDALNSVPQRVKGEVDRSFDIANRIALTLKQRGWTQTDLAKKTGKTCSEVSKWLSGTQNFTLRTIALIEEALGTELIQVKGYNQALSHVIIISSEYSPIKASHRNYRIPNKLTYYGQDR